MLKNINLDILVFTLKKKISVACGRVIISSYIKRISVMPKHEKNENENDKTSNNYWKIIQSLFTYLSDNWLKLLIFYLLASQVMRALAKSEPNKLDDKLVQSLGIKQENYNYFLKFNYEESYNQLIELIGTKKLVEADRFLDDLLDRDVLSDHYIMLAEIKMEVNHELANKEIVIAWAEKILDIDPIHELALANLIRISIDQNDEEKFFTLGRRLDCLPMNILHGHYARAIFRNLIANPLEYNKAFPNSSRNVDAPYNIALGEDVIYDLKKCIELASSENEKEYFIDMLDSFLDEYEIGLASNSYDLGFAAVKNNYTAFLNSASVRNFQANNSGRFSSEEIDLFVNCGLIMRNPNFSVAKAVEEHRIFLPINGTDTYSEYLATVNLRYYTLEINKIINTAPVRFNKQTLCENVVGVLLNSGQIVNSPDMLSEALSRAKEYDMQTLGVIEPEKNHRLWSRTKKNSTKTSLVNSNNSYLWNAIIIGSSIVGAGGLYWLWQKLRAKIQAPSATMPSLEKIRIIELLTVIEEYTSYFTHAKWQSADDILTLDLTVIKAQFDLCNSKFSQAYSQIKFISLDSNLLLERLIESLKLFGSENVILDSNKISVILMTERLPKKKALENTLYHMFEEMIHHSQEYLFPILNEQATRLENNLNNKVMDINEKIKELLDTLVPARIVSQSYLENEILKADKEIKERAKKIDTIFKYFNEQIALIKVSKTAIYKIFKDIKQNTDVIKIKTLLKKAEDEMQKFNSIKLYFLSIFESLDEHEKKLELAVERLDKNNNKNENKKVYIQGLKNDKHKNKPEISRYQKEKNDQIISIQTNSFAYRQLLDSHMLSMDSKQESDGNIGGQIGMFGIPKAPKHSKVLVDDENLNRLSENTNYVGMEPNLN